VDHRVWVQFCLLVTLIGVTALSPMAGGTAVSQSSGDAPKLFDIVIEGSIEQSPFGPRSGTLELRPVVSTDGTTNGVNPFDACLKSGVPAGAPEPGAIWLFTNNACAGSSAGIDLASVSWDDSQAELLVLVDPNLSSTGANNFTMYGGYTASIYTIIDGGMQVRFSDDGTIVGIIDAVGTANYNAGMRYQANFSGEVAD
jgi:hypothetical protein